MCWHFVDAYLEDADIEAAAQSQKAPSSQRVWEYIPAPAPKTTSKSKSASSAQAKTEASGSVWEYVPAVESNKRTVGWSFLPLLV